MNSDSSTLRTSDIWHRMKLVGLDEMKTVRLMSRIDTKYVAPQHFLMPLLEEMARRGYLVQFTGQALNGYDTLYYDTPDREMFRMHHDGKLRRSKIRCRTYTDSDLSFLEVKNKSNKGRTEKIRMELAEGEKNDLLHNGKAQQFVGEHSDYRLSVLRPALQTLFDRITLVNKEKTERITIDTRLRFHNYVTGRSSALDDLLIIELKQDGRYPSGMRRLLRELRVKPFKISKYCIGTTLTDPDIKSNRFRRKIHLLNKLKNQVI